MNSPESLPLRRLCMFLLGAVSLWMQVIFLRELLVLSHGNELNIGVGLSAWLSMVALWSWVGGKFEPKPHRLGILFALAPVLFLTSFWLLTLSRSDTLLPGESPSILRLLAVSILALCPPTAFAGLGYAQGVGGENADRAGRLYAAENLGAAFAGALFHFLLSQWLDNTWLAFVAGAGCAVLAIPLLWPRLRHAAILLPFALIAIAYSFIPEVEKSIVQASLPDEHILASVNSRHGRLTVVERESQRTFLHDSVLLFTTQDQELNEERVHLPMLLHPQPRRILLLGGCVGGGLQEVLRHQPDHVDCLEWDPTLVELAQRLLDPVLSAVLADPRVTVLTHDGRVHLRASKHRYDLILLTAPIPKSAFLARLISLETMEDASQALKPDGLFVVATPGNTARFDPATVQRHAMLQKTMDAVFPFLGMSPGILTHFWGSNRPLFPQVSLLSERLKSRGITPSFIGPAWLEERFLPFHLARYQSALSHLDPEIHSELYPRIYFLGMLEELTLSLPFLATTLASLVAYRTQALFIAFALGILAMGILLIRPRSSAPGFAAFSAGATGITLEMLALLAFQSIHGDLYHALGGLLALFMVGMVGGTYLGKRLASRNFSVGWASAIGSAVAALSIWGLWAAWKAPDDALLSCAAIAFLAGIATASSYIPAVAQAMRNRPSGSPAARMYALDLLGSASAALLAVWILLPLWGFPMLGVMASLLCAISALANTQAW